MTAPFILAIDQGTTGSTVVIVDQHLSVHARVNQEFQQFFPQAQWVEHDPGLIWQSVCSCMQRACQQAGIAPREIAAIGITNQRETVVVWDRATGQPIHRAIVWQDRRTRGQVQQWIDDGFEPKVQDTTGLTLDPYFSASKLAWLLDRVPQARARAEQGDLLFGTIDSYLLWQLTGGVVHATDISNASRTLLMNLRTGTWDEAMLKLFNVPAAMLPGIVDNAGRLGTTAALADLPAGIPITGMAGDQQAALFGQACFEPGQAKCTYGTGAFLLMNTGNEPVSSRHRLLSTVAWRLDGSTCYALEGSAFVAGALVQWLRDGLGIIDSATEVEALAMQVDDSDGVVVMPSLSGLGAPHWNASARGMISGLTRGTTAAHIARAALEAIALQNVDVLQAMEHDSGQALSLLKVDGGASNNDLLMQMQADFLDRPIERPAMTDTTALGAAMLAGLGVGVFADLDSLRGRWQCDRAFQACMPSAERRRHLEQWTQALHRVS
jgi:glycerol kinase